MTALEVLHSNTMRPEAVTPKQKDPRMCWWGVLVLQHRRQNKNKWLKHFGEPRPFWNNDTMDQHQRCIMSWYITPVGRFNAISLTIQQSWKSECVQWSRGLHRLSMLKSSGVDEECKYHDQAVKKLQAGQAKWYQWHINEELPWSTKNSGGKIMPPDHPQCRCCDLWVFTSYWQPTRPPGDGTTALRLLYIKPWAKRLWDRLCYLRFGCSGSRGLQTHQVIQTDCVGLQNIFPTLFCCPDKEQWVFPKSYTLQC